MWLNLLECILHMAGLEPRTFLRLPVQHANHWAINPWWVRNVIGTRVLNQMEAMLNANTRILSLCFIDIIYLYHYSKSSQLTIRSLFIYLSIYLYVYLFIYLYVLLSISHSSRSSQSSAKFKACQLADLWPFNLMIYN